MSLDDLTAEEQERFLTLLFYIPKWDRFLTQSVPLALYNWSASHARASWNDRNAPVEWPVLSRVVAEAASRLTDFGTWTNRVRTARRLRHR